MTLISVRLLLSISLWECSLQHPTEKSLTDQKMRAKPISADPSAPRTISTADGPRARIAPASEDTKQKARGVDSEAGLDAKPGGGGGGGGGGGVRGRGCRLLFPFFL